MGVRWRRLYQALSFFGWCLTVIRSEEKTEEDKGTACTGIRFTDQKKQQEQGLVDCPDNQAYFLIVAAAFIGGLVVSYVVLQFIIRCSQIGAPKAKKGKDDKKKQEKKPKEEKKEKAKEELATSSAGANGGVAVKA